MLSPYQKLRGKRSPHPHSVYQLSLKTVHTAVGASLRTASQETVHLRATLRVFPKLVTNDQRILLLRERVCDTEV